MLSRLHRAERAPLRRLRDMAPSDSRNQGRANRPNTTPYTLCATPCLRDEEGGERAQAGAERGEAGDVRRHEQRVHLI